AIPSSVHCASRIKSLPASIDSFSAPLLAPFLRSAIISSTLSSSTSWQQRSRSNSDRSEEHTSELQSLAYLVCRLLLEKKNLVCGRFCKRGLTARARRSSLLRTRQH